jgi:DNA helicase II / ATP-dependent DNA helicase PcrA
MEQTGIFIRQAVAGSGKTASLMERVFELLNDEGDETGSIALVTYTREAATEIHRRLVAMGAGEQIGKRLVTGTLHSIATRVMNRYRRGAGLPLLKVHQDGRSSYGLAECIAHEAAQTPNLAAELKVAGVHLDYRGLAKRFSCLMDLLPSDCLYSSEELAPYFSNPVLCDFAGRSLSRWRASSGGMQFSDYTRIIPEVTHLIRANPEDPNLFAPRDVLVDEFQDLSPRQVEFVDALCRFSRSLYVVGCPDQSIYGFRAGGTHSFNELPSRLAMAEHLSSAVRVLPPLDYSYRCPAAIAEASVSLLEHNRGGMGVPMRGHPSGRVDAGWFNDEREEVETITGSIARLPHEAFGRIAILGRTHQAVEPYFLALIGEQVPVRMMRVDDPVSNQILGRITNWLKISQSPADMDAGKQILRAGIPNVGPATIAKIEKKLTPHEAVHRRLAAIGAMPGLKRPQIESVMELAKRLDHGSQVLKRSGDLIHWLQWLNDRQSSLLIPEGVEQDDYRRVMDFAFRLARACYTPGRFIDTLSEPTQPDHVTVGTFHAAKGREWPTVFAVGVNRFVMETLNERLRDDLFAPGVLDAGIEGERRLFHVGISRASENLVVTWSGGEKAASRFIHEAGLPIDNTPGVVIPRPNIPRRNDVRKTVGSQLVLF